MAMVVFVASRGLPHPQGLWTVIHHRKGKAAEGLGAGDRMPWGSFSVLSTCSSSLSPWACALPDARRGLRCLLSLYLHVSLLAHNGLVELLLPPFIEEETVALAPG